MEDSSYTALDDILTQVEQDESLRDGGAPKASTATAAPGGAGIGELLSQAGLMQQLPTLLKLFQTLREPPRHDEPSRAGAELALLSALRPYLNDNRRQILDMMIQISRLSDSLRSLHKEG